MEYFKLHPQMTPVCADCRNVSCRCPNGIDIPLALKEIHEKMLALAQKELIPLPENRKRRVLGDDTFGARIVSKNIPEKMVAGQSYRCRINVENAGLRGWHPNSEKHRARAVLGVFVDKKRIQSLEVNRDVHKGDRFHFEFEIAPPVHAKRFLMKLQLLSEHQHFSESLAPILFFRRFLFEKGTFVASPSKRSMKLTDSGFLKSLKRSVQTGLHRLGNHEKESASAPPVARQKDSQEPYDVVWIETNFPDSIPNGESFHGFVRVENRGSRVWRGQHPEGKNVYLVIYTDEKLYHMVIVPRDVFAGESVIFDFPFTFPEHSENEKWHMRFSMVEQNVAWFHDHGVTPLDLEIKAERPTAGANAEAVAISKR